MLVPDRDHDLGDDTIAHAAQQLRQILQLEIESTVVSSRVVYDPATA